MMPRIIRIMLLVFSQFLCVLFAEMQQEHGPEGYLELSTDTVVSQDLAYIGGVHYPEECQLINTGAEDLLIEKVINIDTAYYFELFNQHNYEIMLYFSVTTGNTTESFGLGCYASEVSVGTKLNIPGNGSSILGRCYYENAEPLGKKNTSSRKTRIDTASIRLVFISKNDSDTLTVIGEFLNIDFTDSKQRIQTNFRRDLNKSPYGMNLFDLLGRRLFLTPDNYRGVTDREKCSRGTYNPRFPHFIIHCNTCPD